MGKVLATLLLASVGLNGYLIWKFWGKEPTAVEEPVARGLSKPGPATAKSDPSLAIRTFPGSPTAASKPTGRSDAPAAEEKFSAESIPAPLCQVGLDWLSRRADETVGDFLDFFGELRDPRHLENSYEDNLRQVVNVVGQEKAGATTLRKEYGDLFYKNAREFLSHTTTNPPNFRSMLALSKKYYKEEDALVQRLFGEEKMLQFRASQLKRRVDLTAVLARYTKMTWNEGLQGVDLVTEVPKPGQTHNAVEDSAR
jgi:hypothetical protein